MWSFWAFRFTKTWNKVYLILKIFNVKIFSTNTLIFSNYKNKHHSFQEQNCIFSNTKLTKNQTTIIVQNFSTPVRKTYLISTKEKNEKFVTPVFQESCPCIIHSYSHAPAHSLVMHCLINRIGRTRFSTNTPLPRYNNPIIYTYTSVS